VKFKKLGFSASLKNLVDTDLLCKRFHCGIFNMVNRMTTANFSSEQSWGQQNLDQKEKNASFGAEKF